MRCMGMTARRALTKMYSLTLGAVAVAAGCRSTPAPDAYGNFEATEVVVSAQTSGQIQRFLPIEGMQLARGADVVLIDTVPLGLQREQIVASDEAAFQKNIRRSVTHSLASIDQLQSTLSDDDTIVALRERILGETGFRFAEGVITSAEYVDRETDLVNARLARVTHRVQLAQARANFLTSLGIETR